MSRGKYTYSVKFNDIFPVMMDILGATKQIQLAEFLEVSVAAITNFKSQNYFPIDQVIKFAIKKNISIDYMLGRGTPDNSAGLKIALPPSKADYDEGNFDETKVGKRIEDLMYTKFPFLNKNGKTSFERLQIVKLFALKEWIIPQLIGKPEDVFMTIMYGNSMEHSIQSGDLLLCDGLHKHISEIHIDDSICIITIEGKEPIVRRLQRLPGNMVRVIADNSLYESFSIPLQSDCQVLGRVVWIAHRVVYRGI